MISRIASQISAARLLARQHPKFAFAVVRKYSKEHEWIEYDPSTKTGLIGITTHAAKELGDIVHIEMPEAGLSFNAGASIGTIESVKVAADIYAPVDGKIHSINEVVNDDASLVNADANANWIFKVSLSNDAQLKDLMTEQQYLDLLKSL